jgi:hypothetical protein
MGTYRISRNLEASIIEFIRDELTGSWSDVNVEKTFSRVYEIDLPVILVRCGTATHEKAEIGENSTRRTSSILIDIFADHDGQRLDLKDWLISVVKDGFPYYEYEIVNGQIDSKTQTGKIRVQEITDNPIDFDTPKDNLEPHDRYRHLITLEVTLGQVEA